MSRGPGRLQRELVAVFEADPARRFTIEELAALAYPGEVFKRDHAVCIRRALKTLPGLVKGRRGERGGGWRWRFGLA